MTLIVCFTGLDGSGKSTQARNLLRRLEEQGVAVTCVHQYEPTTRIAAALKRFLRRRIDTLQARTFGAVATACPGATETQRTRRSAAWPVIAKLAAVWWLMNGWSRMELAFWRHRRAQVLIFDRCFVDEIVRAVWKTRWGMTLGLWLLQRARVPQVVFNFYVETNVGWSRKKNANTTRHEYERKNVVIREVMEGVGHRWPIDTIDVGRRDEADVANEVYVRVGRLLES